MVLCAYGGAICRRGGGSASSGRAGLPVVREGGKITPSWDVRAGDHGGDRFGDQDSGGALSVPRLSANDQLPSNLRPELSPGGGADAGSVPQWTVREAGCSELGRSPAWIPSANAQIRSGTDPNDRLRFGPGSAGAVGPVALADGDVWRLGGRHTSTGDALQDHILQALPVPSTRSVSTRFGPERMVGRPAKCEPPHNLNLV